MFQILVLGLLCTCGILSGQTPVCQEVPFTIPDSATGTISINSDGELVIEVETLVPTVTSLRITVVGTCTAPIVLQVNPPIAPFTIPPSEFASCFDCPNDGVQIQLSAYMGPVLVGISPVIPFITCCTEPCVHTLGYWETHNIYEKKRCNKIPWPIPEGGFSPSEDTVLCDKTWLQILQSDSKSDWIKLAKQWIVAQLNVASGATLPPEIASILSQTETLLNQCDFKAKNCRAYELFTESLCAYNAGVINAYPPLCCCEVLDPEINCVHAVPFWATHNIFETERCNQVAWPTDGVTPAEENVLCGRTWLDIIQSPANTTWEKLAQEWIAVMLNQANGVTIPLEISTINEEARVLLNECNTTVKKNRQYKFLTNLLHIFNSGEFNEVNSEYPPECCDCKCA